jgi:hypothetical protein
MVNNAVRAPNRGLCEPPNLAAIAAKSLADETLLNVYLR